MRCLIAYTIFLILVTANPAHACSCSSYPKPFCARDLDVIDSSDTIIFMGRATEEGMDPFSIPNRIQEELRLSLSAEALAAKPPSEAQIVVFQAAKRVYLQIYGDRLAPEKLSQLQDANSMDSLTEFLLAIESGGQAVEFEILETFVGELSDRIDIHTGFGGGDCGYRFKQGESYLIEAHRSDSGEWHAWMCSSRVSHLKWAAEDLRTLRAWKEGNPLSPRVYGTVEDWTTRKDNYSGGYPPASGVRLKLLGGAELLETVTDGEGRFQIESLERREYRLELDEPGWSQNGVSKESASLDLKSSGCAEVSVLIEQDQGVIHGRVRPQPGEPLPDYLWIEAIPVDAEASHPFDATTRAPAGTFAIDEIEPGTYYVAINVDNTPSGPHHPSAQHGRVWPYPPTYYPGTPDPKRAAVFRLERGQTIELEDWTLPPRLAERRMTGKAVLPGGTPAANVRILLTVSGHEDAAERSGPTAADGRFEIWPLETLSYTLNAAAYDANRDVVYKGSLAISPDTTGPLLLQLKPTGLKPDDQTFFSPFLWEKD